MAASTKASFSYDNFAAIIASDELYLPSPFLILALSFNRWSSSPMNDTNFSGNSSGFTTFPVIQPIPKSKPSTQFSAGWQIVSYKV
ncbi:hypothetical protein Hanom_Chr07g00600321 [Helianthus anomalus]